MIIYHVEFAKTGTGISGGEVVMLEFIRYYANLGIKNVIFTTDNGKEVYQKTLSGKNIEYRIIYSHDSEKRYGALGSYLLRPFMSWKLVKNFKPSEGDILICHSEYFPNSIPSFLFSRMSSSIRLGYWFHMQAPSIWRGYQGEFTGRKQFPRPRIIFYKLNQWLYRRLTPSRAVILTSNKYYLDFLRKKYSNEIGLLFNHGEGLPIKKQSTCNKEYDLIWLGRLHQQKGLLELTDIVSRLTRTHPNIRTAVIGDGDPRLKKSFLHDIESKGLMENIIYLGALIGEEKNQMYEKSKIFLMTSYFESFGLVNLEAMSQGLPVVAYNLPVFEVFDKGMLKVPILDNESMAIAVNKLLEDQHYYDSVSNDAIQLAQNHSWEADAERALELIQGHA
jgi:glycosyltransferase involved in cell wall biosynthesis